MDGLLLPWWQEASYHHAREQERCAWPAESVTHGLHPSAADRVADCVGGSLITVDERVRRPQLRQQVEIGIANERLTIPSSPRDRPLVEVDASDVH
jgi:hypothetical protein